jgi:hypothetical protein
MVFEHRIRHRPVQPAPAGLAAVARSFRRRADERLAAYGCNNHD